MRQVPAVSSNQILSLARDKITEGSTIRSDGWHAYEMLASNNYVHDRLVVSNDKQALRKLKWVHLMTANIKGNIRGVYHGVSAKHLDRYLAEFSYRFNRRFWDSQLFDRALTACASTFTVTFAELKA